MCSFLDNLSHLIEAVVALTLSSRIGLAYLILSLTLSSSGLSQTGPRAQARVRSILARETLLRVQDCSLSKIL